MNKKLAVMLSGIFMLVLLLGLGSAVSIVSFANLPTNPTLVNHTDGSVNLTFQIVTGGNSIDNIKLNVNVLSGIYDISFSDLDGKYNVIKDPTNTEFIIENVENGTTVNLSAKVTFAPYQSTNLKGTLTATGTTSSSKDSTFDIRIESSPSLTISQSGLSKTKNGTILVKNEGNTVLTGINFISTESADFNVSYNLTGFTLNAGESKIIEISSNDAKNLEIGEDNSLKIKAYSGTIFSDEQQITVKNDFCAYGNKGGDLEINDFKIDNLGDGSDEEWENLDEIKIEVEIENTNNKDDVSDVEVELRILNEDDKDVTGDFLDDEIYDIGKIYEDDKDVAVFDLKVDPEVKEGTYKIYVKAYSEGSEDLQCIDDDSKELNKDTYYEIKVKTDKDFGIDQVIFPETISCGDNSNLIFDFYNFNLGDNEEMRVRIYNSNLGISSYSKGFELDEGEREELSFEIKIPEEIKETGYEIKVYVEHDYKEKDDSYRKSPSEYESVLINVKGSCTTINPTLVAKSISEEIRAGKEFVFESTFTNPGEEKITLNIHSEGHEEWSKLRSISPSVLILNPGESKEVIFKYDINKDVQGEKIFIVKAINSQGKVVLENPISTGEIQSANLFSKLPKVSSRILGMVLLNAVLILLIVVVLVRISRRR